MVIFIDAYNALRFLFPQDRHSTEAQRAHFLQQLSAYVQVKKHDGVEVRVVFDGGMMPHRHREVHGGVIVMEAGYGRDADSYIVECVERHDSEVLVVTNDRELQHFCKDEGAQVMKVAEFWDIVRGVIADGSNEHGPRHPSLPAGRSLTGEDWSRVQKIDDSLSGCSTSEHDMGFEGDTLDAQDIDSLMIEASLGVIPFKENDDEEPASRTSHGRKLSKKEKQAQRLRKKIR